MSVNSMIIAALESFGNPVKPNFYEGNERIYYTFEYSTMGDFFSDDAPGVDVYLITVHFVCPLSFDPVERVKETKKSLFVSGCTWPDVINDSEKDEQHYIFTCQYAEGVDLSGAI